MGTMPMRALDDLEQKTTRIFHWQRPIRPVYIVKDNATASVSLPLQNLQPISKEKRRGHLRCGNETLTPAANILEDGALSTHTVAVQIFWTRDSTRSFKTHLPVPLHARRRINKQKPH